MEENQSSNRYSGPDKNVKPMIEKLAYDFRLLDTWHIPLKTEMNQQLNLHDVLQVIMSKSDNPTMLDKMSDLLFSFRSFLGRHLGWDKQVNTLPIPGCKETSLKDRIKDLQLTEQIEEDILFPDLELVKFRTVFNHNNERLMELSNNTVHGLIHYHLQSTSNTEYRLMLSIYVKTRGWLGDFYMKLITPFRHLIIYPALVKGAIRNWENHSKKS